MAKQDGASRLVKEIRRISTDAARDPMKMSEVEADEKVRYNGLELDDDDYTNITGGTLRKGADVAMVRVDDDFILFGSAVDACYPVGSVYTCVSGTPEDKLKAGTWEKLTVKDSEGKEIDGVKFYKRTK